MYEKRYLLIKKVFFSFLLVTAHSLNCFTQYTLEYYLKAAKENNPSIKENFAMADKAVINEKRAKAENIGPQAYISGDIFYPPMIGNKNDPDAIGYDPAITDGGLYSLLFNVTQPLFTKSVNEVMINRAKLTGDLNREKAVLVSRQIEKNVTEQYVLAFQDLIQINFIQSLIYRLEEQKKIIEALAEKGIYMASDVLLTEIQIQAQKTEMNKFKSSYLKNISGLNDLCGLKQETDVVLTPPGISLNPFVRESRFNERFRLDSLQEVFNLRSLNLKYKPHVNLYGNMGINAIELPGIQRRAGMGFGISLILPVYDGNQKQLNSGETEINLRIINNYRQNFLTMRENQQKAVLAELQLIDDRISIINDQILSYEKLISLFDLKLRAGELEIINYLNVIKSYISAKNDLTLSETSRLLIINESNYYNW